MRSELFEEEASPWSGLSFDDLVRRAQDVGSGQSKTMKNEAHVVSPPYVSTGGRRYGLGEAQEAWHASNRRLERSQRERSAKKGHHGGARRRSGP
jgi:hypothetical protein